MKILLTGGLGFIGSAVVRHLIADTPYSVVVVDKRTYAASPEAVAQAAGNRLTVETADVADPAAMAALFARHDPDAVMHLAAETHVDRSIDGPAPFILTNVVGTFTLLEAARAHRSGLSPARAAAFRFHHVSTDEVFGSLYPGDPRFTETTAYDPRSPYAASKAASDHLVRAWGHTHGLPIVVTNTCNNYGPWQFPEKLIPLVALNALEGLALPVYGKGDNVRDWIHVEDHARALVLALTRGVPGETYAIGSEAERTNLEVVQAICAVLDRLSPDPAGPRERLITFVPDRPGHDFRYAIDAAKARSDLGWTPRYGFEDGLEATLAWYLEHETWWGPIRAQRYRGQRLGTGRAA